ncbi:MAG: biopolymer transport protein ExbB [Cycloclasticus pugetii]|jgi:biopolymer transport protein ExbB|uniref:MotA/TolQ/ExbB proton channel n=1 Tax=Cycloclasticus zancles 78-ME TaxID=1198232 RepID=S5TA41_9GAMM|nr:MULTISPECIES: MotA/TolQ/ExbB proton channel family protein [Cycloclasticus]AFT66390.1 MotA/TolQ/ExbB proton channel [Cycloclasticus sp. P1]AGS40611.1 MotA/TolQ/ExbB proton channel [Cycloclasticus zancles 78-ME]MDF1830607.1 MotA/TolQ/ExbB proton channel family protein [Cycloclasticus pugetii]
MSHLLITSGPVVWLLIVFSVVSLTVTLLKIWQFWQLRDTAKSSIGEALSNFKQNKVAQAIVLVNGQRHLRSALVAQALQLLDSGVLSTEEAKNEILRKARFVLADLAKYLRVLEVIASLAPLLGLLGTVLGMVEAFKAMEAAGSQVNPAILSGGIWMALMTTAMGVAVAIPTSIIHSWFERKIEVQAILIQDDLDRVFTIQAERKSVKPLREVAQA